MRPISFKGATNVFSNFYPHWLEATPYNLWGYSVEQHYQYLCANYNGYPKIANDILQVPPQEDNGMVCKQLAKGITFKSEMWQECKANILFELLELKFEQCTPFREALMATERPLIHPVASPFWGTGFDHQGQNVCGKLLMDLRVKKMNELGVPKLKVRHCYR